MTKPPKRAGPPISPSADLDAPAFEARIVEGTPTWPEVGIARIKTGLSRQTVYRIKDDPESAEAALAAWGL